MAVKQDKHKVSTQNVKVAATIQRKDECTDENNGSRREALDLDKDKHTAYYSALVEAWVNTQMEKDKSLLTLATGGIGLLITLLTTVGVASHLALWLYVCGLASFLITILSAVSIFRRNARFIQCLINDDAPSDRDLKRLDRLMYWSFILGLVSSIGVGITTGI